MRIATLQLAPKLGDVEGNIKKADELLKRGKRENGVWHGIESLKPDVLVLPELALTGYNFPSLESIRPYLEPVGEGPTAKWARETAKSLQCKVCVGYPEIEKELESASEGKEKYYNSLLVVDENGELLLNYRKAFLYYTDETWASEGRPERGFYTLTFDSSPKQSAQGSSNINKPVTYSPTEDKKKQVATSFGICMDINPYRFEAPFTAWELANRVLESKSQLVIISMAWLSLLSREELDNLANKPEMDTFQYWIRRFWPLLQKKMNHNADVDVNDDNGGVPTMRRVIIVFANRAGEEEGAADKPTARYAGTSAVVAVTQRSLHRQKPTDAGGETECDAPFDVKILCWDIIGATEEGICFADTTTEPKLVFGVVKREGSGDESD